MNANEHTNGPAIEKDLLFLAYANSAEDPLSFLKKEHDDTVAIFDQSPSETMAVDARLGVTRAYIVDYLISHREKILVFQYSGHAEQDALILEDDVTNPKGIVKLLAQCPKLKLVILNGCSTHQQVKLILSEREEPPVVISTHAPVKDQSAYQYAIGFWKSFFGKNESINQAHLSGLGAAMALKNDQEIKSTRGVGFHPNKAGGDPLWDISSLSDMDVDWTPAHHLARTHGGGQRGVAGAPSGGLCPLQRSRGRSPGGHRCVEPDKRNQDTRGLALAYQRSVAKIVCQKKQTRCRQRPYFL